MAETAEPGGAPPRVRPLILAAGGGTRFGGAKLSARVDGKPILRHVIDAALEAGLGQPVVVLGPGDPSGVDLGGATIVRNPEPERGIASSLQAGWASVMTTFSVEDRAPDSVLVLLGDQPLVQVEVLRALAALPLDPERPIAAPRYRGSSARNPVRIEATAGSLVRDAAGDRGLGPAINANPGAIRWVDIDGDNPDVDTAADLAHVADLAWARRVRANAEQVERFREAPDGPDFYASLSSIFRDDPDRVDDVVLDALRARTGADDSWLDVGAGAGRYALPLARAVKRLIALDPSPSMLGALRESMEEHGIDNIEIVQGRWPEAAEDPNAALRNWLPVDVSLLAHVGYDIELIWPFLEAMERATRRECLAVLMERSPATLAEPFWPELHGERRVALPALSALVDLLTAHGRRPNVTMLASRGRRWSSPDEAEAHVRRQTWVAPGSEKDRRLRELLEAWLVQADDGTYSLKVVEPLRIGLVAWEPGRGA